MSTVTAAFYAAATLLLGIIAVSVIPTGGWGGQARTSGVATVVR